MTRQPPISTLFPYTTLFRSSPIGDSALADPRHEVLVHDMRIDPAPGLLVANRSVPVRDALLAERLHLLGHPVEEPADAERGLDRKSTRLNSSHANISYAVFC